MPMARRRSMVRFLLERQRQESVLLNIDKSEWYRLQNPGHLTEDLRQRFHQSTMDCGTQDFIDHCYQRADSFFLTLWLSVLRSILKLFMTSTSVCGYLGCGSMFVFSDHQLKQFLFPVMDLRHGTLLDIGAGNGNVTAKLAPYFQRTYVTELSRMMQSRLTERRFRLLDADRWDQADIRFDLISCLNVLDRCDRPLEMLEQCHQSLMQSNGFLLLAVVLPLYQYVEYKRSHEPDEELPVRGVSFEEQATSLYRDVLLPAGFEVVRWTKLPYLSEGNQDLTYFWLIDAVFLLRPIQMDPCVSHSHHHHHCHSLPPPVLNFQ